MSEQKDNEAKSARQGRWLIHHSKKILETAIDGFCVVGLDGELLEVNSALCDITGYSKEELLAMKLADLESWESPEKIEQHKQKVMKEGYDHFETKHRRKDGKILDIEVSTQYCDFDEEKFFFSFFRDITEHSMTEKALRESEVKYRNLVENLPAITYIAAIDAKSTTLYISPQVENILGVSVSDYKNDPDLWRKMLHTQDCQRVMSEVTRSHNKGEPFISEYRMIAKDGHEVYICDDARIIRDDVGKPLYLQGVMYDITQRKKAEEALRESEEKFRRLFEETTDAIFIADAQTGIITDCNNAAAKLVGRKKSELVGKHQRILHPPEEVEGEFSRTYKQHLSEKEGQILEAQAITKKGEIKDVTIRATRFELKGKKRVQAMFRDITWQKKMENALRKSEERYRTLFQSAAEGIIVADIETKKFKYVNPAICEMLGYTEEELIRLGVRDIHPEEDLQHIIFEFEAQAQREKTLSSSIPCLRKDGTIIYADINAAVVLRDGRRCSVGFFTDITERKRMEAELANHKDKVFQTQRHTYISSMGAVVAHQLNQPLTKINILLDRAVEQLEEALCCPSALKNVKQGLVEVKNATSIIQKFRRYSKDSAMESVDKINVRAVADRIVSMLSGPAMQAKIRIALKGLGDLSEVEANEAALEQIFLIIIQNAIEAADGRKSHKLDITGKLADGNIELQFSDDCCGIAPQNLDKIFEPFFTTKTKDQGMGLGLDIVQQVLISCGGQIRVESRLGRGTTFYVTLPVRNTPDS